MNAETIDFFSKKPKALPLYEAFQARVCSELADVHIKVQKSQIAFSNRRGFAAVWLPIRKMKNRPEICIIVTFGLPQRIESTRIAEAVEPYPMRWTHHVIIKDPEDIDDELMGWIKRSYQFSMEK